MSQEEYQDDGELQVLEQDPALKAPQQYHVVLHNDDYTPMNFVVDVLIRFFNKNKEESTRIMLSVHTKGKGICGTYTKDIATSKASQVNSWSKENQYPLLCDIEEA